MLYDGLENRGALLRRASTLLGRVMSQLSSQSDPQFGPRFTADARELGDAMEKLGVGPLGKRFAKEAAGLAEGWTNAYGLGSFLDSFNPEHERHCMAATARLRAFVELLRDVIDEFDVQRESYSLKSNLELAVLSSHVTTIAKAQTAIRKLTPSVQAGLAEIAPDIRRRARDVLERISTRCSEAAGPKELGLRVIPMTCRPDLEEAVGSLRQLGFAPQGRRLEMAFDEMVAELNRGFLQDGSHELKAICSGSAPPPKDDEEEAERQARRWLFKRAVSDLGKVANELLTFVKPTRDSDVTSAAPRGDEPEGDGGATARVGVATTSTEPPRAAKRVPADAPRITVSEIAYKVRRSKDAVRKVLKATGTPKPCVVGRPGQANQFHWDEMRRFCDATWGVDLGEPPPRHGKNSSKKPPT